MALMRTLFFSSLFLVTGSQVTPTNVRFCYDDPRLEFVGFTPRSEENTTEFAVRGTDFELRIRGKLRTFSRGFYPQTIISEEINDKDSNFPLDILQTDEPEPTIITTKQFLYFRNVKNRKYRLLGFVQEFLGCPAPLCFSSTLDAANVYIVSGKSYELHVFRGKWFWDISSPPLVSNARMIGEVFLGMPDNIDAAFSIGSEENHNLEVYFFKEDRVYIKLNKLWPRQFRIVNMFNWNGQRLTSVDAAFPGSYEVNERSKVFLLSRNQLLTFMYNTSLHSWYSDSKIETVKLRKELINTDAAYSMIFAEDSEKNEVYFFKSWICQKSSMKDFPKGINKVTLKMTLSMENPFNCPSDLYYNKKIGITSLQDYKDLYVAQFLVEHDRGLWQQIGISKEGRKDYALVAVVVLTISFIIPLTAMIWFFFTSLQWRRRTRVKVRHPREPESKIAPATSSYLLDRGYTPSQVGTGNPSVIDRDIPPQVEPTPSTLMDMGYSRSQLVHAGVLTHRKEKRQVQEATPSQLLAVGYSPSQLVTAGIATPSTVGLSPISEKKVEMSAAKSHREQTSRAPSNAFSEAFHIAKPASNETPKRDEQVPSSAKVSTQPKSAARSKHELSHVGLSEVFDELSAISKISKTGNPSNLPKKSTAKEQSKSPKTDGSNRSNVANEKSRDNKSKSSNTGKKKQRSLTKKSSDTKKTSKSK